MAPTITHSTYKKILIAFTIVISPQIEIHLYQAIQTPIKGQWRPSLSKPTLQLAETRRRWGLKG